MAAAIEVGSLREALLMLCAGRLGDSCLSQGVLKVLAGEAHHEGSAGSELPCSHRRPGAWRGCVDKAHGLLIGNYVLLALVLAVNVVLGRMES